MRVPAVSYVYFAHVYDGLLVTIVCYAACGKLVNEAEILKVFRNMFYRSYEDVVIRLPTRGYCALELEVLANHTFLSRQNLDSVFSSDYCSWTAVNPISNILLYNDPCSLHFSLKVLPVHTRIDKLRVMLKSISYGLQIFGIKGGSVE